MLVGEGRESRFFPLDAKRFAHCWAILQTKKNYKYPFIIQQSIFSEINITVINGAILETPSLKLGARQGLTHENHSHSTLS